MKKILLALTVSSLSFGVVDYDQYADDAAGMEESTSAASTSKASIESESSAKWGYPSLEYSSSSKKNSESTPIMPTNANPYPTSLTKWDFHFNTELAPGTDLSVGAPILQSKGTYGTKSELGNPTAQLSMVWFQGKDPEPVKLDYLIRTSMPRRGSSVIIAHNRWDVGTGLGTSKRFSKVMIRLEGLYWFKMDGSGAAYNVGDMVQGRGALALSITKEIDTQVVMDYRRAYGLKQDNQPIIGSTALQTISPQLIVHLNPMIDCMLGATFATKRQQFEGKEYAFGDWSYDGLLGDQFTIGIGMQI